eukprot:Tamp_03593.p1 GENE.Tamp_03593~~Tamp_03593.p1  ORF type:complete len:351 (-),score=72.63 Tamp_03593:1796-2848(-)
MACWCAGVMASLQEDQASTRRHSISLIIGADTSPCARGTGGGRSGSGGSGSSGSFAPTCRAAPSTHDGVLLLHLTYLAAYPYPEVQPQRSMIATSLRGGARRTTGEELPVSMVVNTGHDIRFLTLAYKSSSLGQSLGPFGRLHYDISARVERRSKRDGGEVLDSSDVELLQSSWDVEEYLSHLLVEVAKSASFSLAVRDYDVRIIDSLGHTCPAHVRGHGDAAATACEDCVALGLVVVVTATGQDQGQTMMFGHMLLLDCITSAVRYSMSTRLQPCHPKVLVPPPGSCTSVLLDRFMEMWRKTLQTPLSRMRDEQVVLMDNDALLKGQCLEKLSNPVLPIDVTAPRRRAS